jgi:chromosome segregation ATPase
MTETMIQTMTDNIASLKSAVREASQYSRELALETDSLPLRVQDAARQDARRKAKAAREGAEVTAVESEIPQLREREKALPFLRWDAAIRHAALEVELYDAQVKDSEQKEREGLKLDADEANRKLNERYNAISGATFGQSQLSSMRAEAGKRLRHLESEYPGV